MVRRDEDGAASWQVEHEAAETVAGCATLGVLFRDRPGTGLDLRANGDVAVTGSADQNPDEGLRRRPPTFKTTVPTTPHVLIFGATFRQDQRISTALQGRTAMTSWPRDGAGGRKRHAAAIIERRARPAAVPARRPIPK